MDLDLKAYYRIYPYDIKRMLVCKPYKGLLSIWYIGRCDLDSSWSVYVFVDEWFCGAIMLGRSWYVPTEVPI